MTTQQTFNTMFENRLNTLMPYLVHTAGGNEDLIQEGAIGIYMSMKKQPRPPLLFGRVDWMSAGGSRRSIAKTGCHRPRQRAHAPRPVRAGPSPRRSGPNPRNPGFRPGTAPPAR